MRLFFWRQKHQKPGDCGELPEHQQLCGGYEELPGLAHRSSDQSSVTASFYSFDPNCYTLEESSSVKNSVPSALNLSHEMMRRRKKMCKELRAGRKKKATNATEENARILKVGQSEELSEGIERKIQELAELDMTVMVLRASDHFGESSLIRPVAVKAGISEEHHSDTLNALDDVKNSELVPRAKTWERHVSALEKCFGESLHTPINSLESVIIRVISFDSDVFKYKPKKPSSGSSESLAPSMEPLSKSGSSNSTTKSFHKQLEISVSDAIARIDSQADWSVGSSSLDDLFCTTSEEETSVSVSDDPRHRQTSVSRSTPSVDGDDDGDDTEDTDEDEDDDAVQMLDCSCFQPCHFMPDDIQRLLLTTNKQTNALRGSLNSFYASVYDVCR